MEYFITLDGIEKNSNLTKDQAIRLAKTLYDKCNGVLPVGIGKYKYVKGRRVYTLLPLHYFI